MERGKVLRVLWINERADFTGGCEQYVYETAQLLQDYGVESSLLYGVEGWTEPEYLRPFERAFPLVDLPLQVQEEAPDVIYVHRLRGRTPVEELVGLGVPLVRFFHDHQLFCLREHKYTALGRQTCTRPLGRHCYPCGGMVTRSERWPGVRLSFLSSLQGELESNKKLDAFVVGSHYMAGHLAEHGFAREKIHTLPLYAQGKPPENAVPREEDLFLFVGQLVRGKGVDLLLEALATPGVGGRLVLCGAGRQQEDFRRQCARLGLEERVTFVGKVSHEELGRYYQRATAVVVPSRTPETFGLVGLEAMRHGTPVIATAVGGMNEWLQANETGLFVPANDSRALAQAMKELLEESERGRQMGRRGQQRFLKKFQPEHHLDGILGLFERLALHQEGREDFPEERGEGESRQREAGAERKKGLKAAGSMKNEEKARPEKVKQGALFSKRSPKDLRSEPSTVNGRRGCCGGLGPMVS